MTLVVARKIKDNIRIFSDTKRSDVSDVLKGVKRNILKTIILNEEICVSFAGRIGWATNAICQLRKTSLSVDEVQNYLLRQNIESVDEVDFIVASLSREPSITKISGGIVESGLDQCWIGNKDAFNTFQKHFHSIKNPNIDGISKDQVEISNTLYRMKVAFERLVEQGKHSDVGEIYIETASLPTGFCYIPRSISFSGSKEIFPNVSGGPKEYFASLGSYTYSILTPESSGIGIIGVHYYPGEVGILLSCCNSDKSPIIYENVTEDQFIFIVSSKHSMTLRSVLSP